MQTVLAHACRYVSALRAALNIPPRINRRPARPTHGRSVELLEPRQLLTLATGTNAVLDWNQVLLDTIRSEKTAPPQAARHLAMLHTAVFDAINSIEGGYRPYLTQVPMTSPASSTAAAASAGFTVLASLYPTQRTRFNTALAANLADVTDGATEDRGVAIGQVTAQAILQARASDGSTRAVTYLPGDAPGDFDFTGTGVSKAVLPQWPGVTPFTLNAADQFRAPAPPALDSFEYTVAYNEVSSLGAKDSRTRTADQTQIARFWAAGGGTVTPPGMWNQIAQTVSTQEKYSLLESAQLFALLNLATADAGIAAWDTKYVYNEWRPVPAIREANLDGNFATSPIDGWTSLLTTPAHPSYVSGHSTFSAAAATILARFTGSDFYSMEVRSDDLPGVTRRFTSFSDAAAEAGQSRIYGGIHWQFDNEQGLNIGRNVGIWVADRALTEAHITPMYRLAHPEFGWHLFTTNAGEFNTLVDLGYRDETSNQTGFNVCRTQVEGTSPLFRLYNPNNGAHYYTLNAGERQGLIFVGLRDEGIEGYIHANQEPGTIPIYRLYNSETGRHLFTINNAECELVLASFPGIWTRHGIVGYAQFRSENVVYRPVSSATRPGVAAAQLSDGTASVTTISAEQTVSLPPLQAQPARSSTTPPDVLPAPADSGSTSQPVTYSPAASSTNLDLVFSSDILPDLM
jgi:hypothetical protein